MRVGLVLCVLVAGCATSSTGGVETAASQPAPVPSKPAAVKPPAPSAKPPPAKPAARTFSNCTELRKVYPGGVAKPGAVNRGEPLTTRPKQDASLYAANEGKDRDGDGLSCES